MKPIIDTLMIDNSKENYTADLIARTFDAGMTVLRNFEVHTLILDYRLNPDHCGETGLTVLELMKADMDIVLPRRIVLNSDDPDKNQLMADLFIEDNEDYHRMALEITRVQLHRGYIKLDVVPINLYGNGEVYKVFPGL